MSLMSAYDYYTSIGDKTNADKYDQSKTAGDSLNPAVIRSYKDFKEAETQYNTDNLYRSFLQVADIDFSKNESTRISISASFPTLYVGEYYDFNGYKWANILVRMNPSISSYYIKPSAVQFYCGSDTYQETFIKNLKIENFIFSGSNYGSCLAIRAGNRYNNTKVNITNPYISVVLDTKKQNCCYSSVFLINDPDSSGSTFSSITIQNMFLKISGFVNTAAPLKNSYNNSRSYRQGGPLSSLIFGYSKAGETINDSCPNMSSNFNTKCKVIDSTIFYNNLNMNFADIDFMSDPGNYGYGNTIVPFIPTTSCLHLTGKINAIGTENNDGFSTARNSPCLLMSDYYSTISSLFVDFEFDTSGLTKAPEDAFKLLTSAYCTTSGTSVSGGSIDASLKNTIYVNSTKLNPDNTKLFTQRNNIIFLTDEQMKDPSYLLSKGFTCFSISDKTIE